MTRWRFRNRPRSDRETVAARRRHDGFVRPLPILLPAAVEVAIFDATGKRVRLLSDQVRGAGLHRVRWDGSDESGREMPSGIYFYRVRGGGVAEMKKIVRSR